MALNFEIFDAAGSAVADGIFIPESDLIGVSAAELAPSEALDLKEGKIIYSIMNVIANNGLANALGLSVTAGAITGQDTNLSSKGFTVDVQYYANQETDVVDVLPLPLIGSNVGVGNVNFTDLFPNAVKVAASGAISGAGVHIPSSLLVPYGSPNQATIDLANDSRNVVGSLVRYMANNADVRDISVPSAVIATTVGDTASLILDVDATDATNPTTGISAADVSKLDTYTKSFSITIQRIENETTQTFDVNSVTL